MPFRFAAQLGAVLGALVGGVAPGTAQAEAQAEILEEILVTATRRESNLNATALSVGVLPEHLLDQVRAVDFESYWRRIPSMSVADSGPFGRKLAIRGLSGNAGPRSDEATVAVYIDDTPVTPPEGFFTAAPDLYLLDIDRVEVVRGPQGTLFGASSMGGTVRTITRPPDPSGVWHQVEAKLSNTHRGGLNYEVSAIWNQPIVEQRSAFRLLAYYRDLDGYIDDVGSGRSNVNTNEMRGMRLSATTRLGSRAALTARVQYQEVDAGSFNETDPAGKPEIGLPVTAPYQLALLVDEFRDDTFLLANVELASSTDAAEWLSVTSYVENRAEYAIDVSDEMNVFYGQYLAAEIMGSYEQQAFTQEFRVTSNGDGRLAWLGGVFFLDQEVPRFDNAPAPGFNTAFCTAADPAPPGAPVPTCTGYPDGEEHLLVESISASRRDYAAFGEVGIDFAGRWEATAGARWYRIEKSLTGTSSGIWVGGFDVPTEVRSGETGVIGKGSVKYRAGDGVTLYALASQGFRPGGANDPSILDLCTDAPAEYESDTLWNYELGAKSTLLDNRVSLNGSIYHIDWSDSQIVVASPICGQTYIGNVGQATSQGLELELTALLHDRWELFVGAGYTDARLDEAIPNPLVDAPPGTELPNVPELTASLATTWRFEALGRSGYLRGSAQYTGAAYSSIDRNIRVRKPAYWLLDLGIGFERGGWRTELFVENLLDEQGMLSCCRLNGEFVTNRPRTMGVRVRFSPSPVSRSGR